jgi:hypothetical protein
VRHWSVRQDGIAQIGEGVEAVAAIVFDVDIEHNEARFSPGWNSDLHWAILSTTTPRFGRRRKPHRETLAV